MSRQTTIVISATSIERVIMMSIMSSSLIIIKIMIINTVFTEGQSVMI